MKIFDDEGDQFSLALKFTFSWGMNQKGIEGGLDEGGYCRCDDGIAHVSDFDDNIGHPRPMFDVCLADFLLSGRPPILFCNRLI